MITKEDRDAAAKLLGYRDAEDMYDYRLSGKQEQQRDETVQAFARHRLAGMEQAAVIAEKCLILLPIGTPGEGPFTVQDRAVDETKAAIATAIRAAKEKG